MNKEFSAGGVVFRKQVNECLFLIIFSARNKSWCFPKGHIEPNETEKQAATREITEETGLHDLKIEKGFREEDIYTAISNRGEFKGQNIEKHSIYFLIKTEQQDVLLDNDEISDYKWLEFNQALALLDFDSAKNILCKADKFLNDQQNEKMSKRKSKEYQCPKCNENLVRKYILYGLPEPGTDLSGYISGGCCVDKDSPKYGYECAVCNQVFILKQGQLILQVDDDEYDQGNEIDNKD